MLVLLITLCGWTQSSQNWKVIKDSPKVGDTTIQYNFQKKSIKDLRIYVTKLSQYKDLYVVNEEIIGKQEKEIILYKTLVTNKDNMLDNQTKALVVSAAINITLDKRVTKLQKRVGRWPYWLASGFLGGIVLCLSVK